MHFTKLRILGFKSFVEPAEFLIEKGLTGVVGPNGCGKSNLVEAIKWVMGESSYKNMRASGMDDVIFSGSGNRPARNTAEVTLVIDNSERNAPAAFNDADTLEITRRIERDSGSVYRINGKEARAKDVQLLFADASTGARSPSMVGQGRIGELIAAKPRQRRLLLEEAAGISGLHSRRHEAELRLKATEQNLERVEDVVTQLDNQLESLKRQARQASRYRNLSGEIRKFEALTYYLRWQSTLETLSSAESHFSEFTSTVASATKLQAETARQQALAASALPALREEAAKMGAVLQRLQLEQGALEKEEAQAQDRVSELDSRLQQLDHDLEREKALFSENKSALENLTKEEETLKLEGESSCKNRQQAQDALDEALEKQKESEDNFNAVTKEIAELNAQRNGLKNQIQQAQDAINHLQQERTKITQNMETIEEQLSQDLFVNASHNAVEEAEKSVAKAEEAVRQADQKTQQERANETLSRNKMIALEKELNALETEARTLTQVLFVGDHQDLPTLIDEMRAEPGYEAALGAALGDDLDVAIDPKASVHWAGADVQHDDPQLPEGVAPLSQFVSAPQLINRRLLQIGVIEEEDAERIVSSLKPGQRLVSRDGGLWRWDGFVAAAEAETPAAQRLAQKNRLADIEGECVEKKAQLDAHSNEVKRTRDDLDAAIQFEKTARDNLRQKISEEVKARDELAKTQSEMSLLKERLLALKERVQRVSRDLETAQSEHQKHKQNLANVPDDAALNQRLQTEQNTLSTRRASAAEAQAAFETLARESHMRGQRLEAILRERQSWMNRREAAERQISILSERKQEMADERKKLSEMPADFARRRAKLFGLVEEAEKNRTKSSETLTEAEEAQRQADQAAKEALTALSQSREGYARAEERLSSAKARKQDLSREIAENLDCSPAALADLGDVKEEASLPEASVVDSRLERLKAERERLGGVNLRAEQEMQEIGEQRDDLIKERDDLIEAIRQLRVAISNLNRQGRERLLAAFEDVQDHFKRLFTHLFGGGTAELQLTESDDPLEAGLEIMARPPGKKPQTMTLLSGGEQALTAMALIFAVFLTNPAPICVLDEVDAPLDDANVERFCNLLEEMIGTTDTRFLTITHNPITMARMGRLFGVTMAERGVSQLVSVDLQTAESYREAG